MVPPEIGDRKGPKNSTLEGGGRHSHRVDPQPYRDPGECQGGPPSGVRGIPRETAGSLQTATDEADPSLLEGNTQGRPDRQRARLQKERLAQESSVGLHLAQNRSGTTKGLATQDRGGRRPLLHLWVPDGGRLSHHFHLPEVLGERRLLGFSLNWEHLDAPRWIKEGKDEPYD